MSTTILHLVRHAEVEVLYQGVFGGRIDMNLSPRGHQQSAALARYFETISLDVIFASPMLRVQQTLSPVLKPHRPAPLVLPHLHEVDFGDWTGLTFAEVKARFGCDAHHWLVLLAAGQIPNAEDINLYRQRIASCLQDILHRSQNQTVGVFCHGGVIRMLLALLLKLPFAEMDRFEVEYASISTVALKSERPRLQLLNFTPWRDISV